MSTADRLIVALDRPDLPSAEAALDLLATAITSFKVGLELFTAVGPPAVDAVHARGASVFLDLKISDIPATARGAIRSAARMGVALTTIHALGGPAMISAAREAAEGTDTRILAVTVLTSLGASDLERLGLTGSPPEAVVRLAEMAIEAGAHGLVCSPQEVAAVRAAVGPEALLVTPGVRPAGAALGDQRRTLTPREAIAAGADRLVVGRPILAAADPLAAARDILEEMEG